MSRMQGFALPTEVAATITALQDRTTKLRANAQAEGRRCYRITNAASPDEAELLLYDDIGGWFGTYADEFVQELNAITAPRLTVRLNSPGGSVFQGLAIASALRVHPADITVRVDGIAASIASVIALAGDRLVVMPGSTLMIHEASGEALGDASVMAKMAEVLDTLSANIADMYAAKAGGTRDEWRQRMKEETWFLADDAVEAGLADEVGPSRTPAPEEPEMRQQFDLTAYGYQGPKQPERPKPAPPAATQTPAPSVGEATLTIPIGSALGEQLANALRACVEPTPENAPDAPDAPDAAPAEPDAAATVDTTVEAEPATEAVVEQPEEAAAVEPEPATTTEPEPPAEPEPVPPAEPADAWSSAFAHLLQPKPDPWADAFAHLVNPQPSSSAATAA